MADLHLKIDASQIVAGAAKAETALDGVKGAAVQAETAVDRLGRSAPALAPLAAGADKAASASVRLASEAEQVGRKSGFAAGGGVRMLGQQLSQVAQQGAVTGNYLGALAVQLPDMALGFGSMAVAASIVGTIAIPLLITAFGGGATAAERMADSQDRLENSLGALRDISSELANMDELRGKYGEVDAALLSLIANDRAYQVQVANTAAKDAITALANEYGVASGQMNLFKITGSGAASGVADALGFTRDQMVGFQIALRDAQNATTFDEQADALARVDGYLARSKISGDEMADAVRKAALNLRAVDKAADDSAASLDEGAKAADKLAKGAKSAVTWFSMVNANITDSAAAADDLARTNMAKGVADAGNAALTLAQRLWNAYSAAASIASLQMQSVSLGGAGRPEGIDIDPDARGAVALARIQIAQKAAEDAAAGAGGAGGGGGGASVVDRTREAYDRLMASLDPVVARSQDMAEATAVADAALAANDITAAEHANAMDLIAQKYTETAGAMTDLQDIGGNAIDALIGGTANLSQALKQMAKDLVFATIKAQLLKAVTGSNSSMSLGTIIMGGLTGGFHDAGGTIPMGTTGMLGERGPELVRATANGAVVTSRVDTAAMMQRQNAAQSQRIAVDIGVTVDNDGMIKAYVRKMGQAAAQAGASQAVQSVKRNLGQWNGDLQRDGALA